MRIITVLVAVFAAVMGIARADWHEVRTPNFLVVGDAHPSTLEDFAQELEDFRRFLGAITRGGQNDEPVTVPVYIMRSDSSFDRIFRSRDVLGVYTNRIETPIFIANAARTDGSSFVRGGRFDKQRVARTVIKHEYVHHYTYKNGPLYYPVWYSEGLAEYLSTFEVEGTVGYLGNISELRGPALRYYKMMPWEDVFGSIGRWRRPGSEMNYAQAWLATHYLRHSIEYAGSIEPYLDRMRADGSRAEQAFEESFGKSYEAVGREIEDYFNRNRFQRLTIDVSAYVATERMTTRRLDKWERDYAIAYAQRFFFDDGTESDLAAQVELIAELRDLHAERPDNVLPLIELAYLHAERSEWTEAQAALDKIVVLAPDLPDVPLIDGLLTSGPGARALFDEARERDPFNALAHLEFAKTFLYDDEIPEDAVNAALTALRLSANRAEVPLVAGELLARTGRSADARYVLEPLVNWSYDDQVARRAALLIAGLDD